jgi:hypothetical protein
VLLDFQSPGWLLATQARTQGLFRWHPLLHDALNGTDVQLLVHSTWRRRCSDRVLQDLLGQDLGPRVIVADYWVSPEDRINLSHAAYIEQVLLAWQDNNRVGRPESAHADEPLGESCSEALSLSILDDRPNLFGDVSRLDAYAPVMIWTDPDLGISEVSIQQRIAEWAKAPPGAADGVVCAHPCSGDEKVYGSTPSI